MRARCGAICLIALFAALSNQERSASKQLAPQLPYTQSQSALGGSVWRHGMDDVGQGVGVDLTDVVWFDLVFNCVYWTAIGVRGK